jgi:hypothetical protein
MAQQNQTQLKFEDRAAADVVNSDVRSDASPTNWGLWGYKKGSKNEIVTYGSGSGGPNELAGHLDAELIQFGLVRVTDTIDGHTTIKFVFLMWVGDKVKFFQKAQIAPHKGEIQNFVGQYHTDLYAENPDEVTEDIIMTKVTDASGSANKVLSADHQRTSAVPRSDAGNQSRVSSTRGQDFGFENEAAAKDALAAVRSGATNWVVFEFRDGSSTVGLAGTGDDGIDGLVATLRPNSISHGLLRVEDIVDEHKTIKFVLVNWFGDQVPSIRKAKLTTFKGTIAQFIGQHHNSVNTSDVADLTFDEIMNKVRDASGSGNRVLAETVREEPIVQRKVVAAPAHVPTTPASTNAPKVQLSSNTSSVPRSTGPRKAAVPTSVEGVVQFDDAIKEAISQVRKNGSGVDWALAGYEGQTSKVVLVGSGGGGLSALRVHLTADSVNYGLLRTENIVDDHVTVKFVFILWIGENVRSIRRAKIATHKGAVTEYFGQFHVDITAQAADEVTDEIIASTVSAAAGTASHVK